MDVFPGLAHVLSRTPRLQTVHLYLKGAPFLPESEIRAVSELNLGLKTGLWGFRSGENRLHQLLELRAHTRSEELSCVGLAGLLHGGAGRARCITPCLLPFAAGGSVPVHAARPLPGTEPWVSSPLCCGSWQPVLQRGTGLGDRCSPWFG